MEAVWAPQNGDLRPDLGARIVTRETPTLMLVGPQSAREAAEWSSYNGRIESDVDLADVQGDPAESYDLCNISSALRADDTAGES